MTEFATRIQILVPMLLWFVPFMAAVYLGLHILTARIVRSPESRVLWFFSIVTGPLTRPVRRLVGNAVPDAHVRYITLGILVALWLVARAIAPVPTAGTLQ